MFLDSRSGGFLSFVSLRPAVPFEFLKCFSVPVIPPILFNLTQLSHVVDDPGKQKKPFFLYKTSKGGVEVEYILSLICGARGSATGEDTKKPPPRRGPPERLLIITKRYCKYPPVILVIHFYIVFT